MDVAEIVILLFASVVIVGVVRGRQAHESDRRRLVVGCDAVGFDGKE